MSFHLPRIARHSSRNFCLLALSAFTFSHSVVLAEDDKSMPTPQPAAPVEIAASNSIAGISNTSSNMAPATPSSATPDSNSIPAAPINNSTAAVQSPSVSVDSKSPNADSKSGSVSGSDTSTASVSPASPAKTEAVKLDSLKNEATKVEPAKLETTKADAPKLSLPKSRSLPPVDPSALSSALSHAKALQKLSASPSGMDSGSDANSTNNAAAIAAISNNPNEKISVQFPHTSILEALSLYEKLTGKRIIRDSNLAGPELSLMIADPVSKKDAVSLLESTMLVNGYTIVPVDDKTVKVIGPSRPPRMEGLPLYQNAADLPNDGERLVSFYQPLHFLSPNEAINILQGVIQINPYGSLVAVPNTSAIVITDKTPIIQKALALLQIIDREPSQIITEFIPLQRADAEKTVETLNQIFSGKESSTPQQPKTPTSPYQQPAPTPTASASGDEETRIFSGKVQFIPDKRTNRILLVTKAENYRYIRELISKLDQAVQFEEPLVRPLNYVSVSDVFPVLLDLLKNKDDDTQNNANKGQTNSNSQNPFNNNNNNSSNPLNPSSGTSGTTGTSGSSSSGGDLLSGAPQLQPPQSAIIGSSSLIGDPTANSIIVYGPPESKIKARQIIDLLDRRPQQVYLAAIIGEMRLTEGMDYGTSYLFHYQGFNTLMSGFTGASVPSALGSLASGAATGAGGLTVFGTLGSLDLYANFLESTGRFRTISRPVVYTSNNRKATILSGQKIPYQSSTLSSVVAGSTSTNTANSLTSNVTYQDVLLKLEVIPLINSDKEVNLIIGQQNQTVDAAKTLENQKNQIYAPTVNTQQLTTSVRVPSGSTIVLGGLIEDEKDTTQAGIPYVDKIPIIGQLLGSHTTKNKIRHELVVMISPTVITSNASMEKASVAEGANTNLGQKGKDLKNKLQPPPPPKKKPFKLFPLPKQSNF